MASPRAIEDAIFALLGERNRGATICPSEVARRLAPKQWRPLMSRVREVAAQLALEGRLVATQKGKEVNSLLARGPVRLKAIESIAGQARTKATRKISRRKTIKIGKSGRTRSLQQPVKPP